LNPKKSFDHFSKITNKKDKRKNELTQKALSNNFQKHGAYKENFFIEDEREVLRLTGLTNTYYY